MKQFIYDMIHMTEGEKLINYWWLWLMLTVLFWTFCIIYGLHKKQKPKRSGKNSNDFLNQVFGGGNK